MRGMDGTALLSPPIIRGVRLVLPSLASVLHFLSSPTLHFSRSFLPSHSFIPPHPPMEFVDNWFITATLGEGAFGEVKLLNHKTSGESVALKVLYFNKKKEKETNLDKEDAERMIKKEISIHKPLKHDNIVKFYGARMEQDVWYIFLEYADGGELYDRIEPDVGLIPHTKTLSYFSQIICGVTYLHSLGIAHRDLKPENILLSNSNDTIKISDFGLSTIYRNEDGVERLLENKCGTPPYLAPEVFSSKTKYKAQPVDVWACGIILVAMLAGELPWDRAEASVSKEYELWKDSTPTTNPWNKFDLATLNFFKRLLSPMPSRRITLEGIAEHAWVKRGRLGKRKIHAIASLAPPVKRPRPSLPASSSSTDSLVSRLCSLSQPDPILAPTTDLPSEPEDHHPHLFAFSQPAHNEFLLEETPRRLVTRMTRFFVKTDSADVIKIVTALLDEFNYSWKLFQEGSKVNVITITSTDRRNNPLVFKCTIIEIKNNTETLVLLDFRLSRGDGLEFKRHFLRLKDQLRHIELSIGAPLEWLIK